MCIAQGAQCYLSGITFGESSNCGRCMKPCRWDWSLKAVAGQETFGQADKGYLLARKDLCLFQHIPALIQQGICSLKIEGRMRTPEFLAPIVTLYRKAVDTYCEDPTNYALSAADMDDMFKKRVREYTTSHMFGHPGLDGVDISGQREPRFFSESGPKVRLTMGMDLPTATISNTPELIAHVSGQAAAKAAFKAGADAVYLNGDGLIGRPFDVTFDVLEALVDQADADRKRLVVLMPAICDVRDMAEWSARIERLYDLDNVGVGVSNLGALQLAKECRIREIVANVGLNVANCVAADELSTLGVSRVTASVEMNYEQLGHLLTQARLPMDVMVQGPMPGMLLEHCVLATASGTTPQGICPMPCRRGKYVMEDVSGQSYPVLCDRRCRNHLYTATDVCVLPNLVRMLSDGVEHLRIEAPFDTPATVETVVGVYREAIDLAVKGQPLEVDTLMNRVTLATGRPVSDGPFDFKACLRRKERDIAHA
jgi:putative protease